MKNRLTLLRPSLTLYMIFKIYESRWVATGLNKSSFGTISTINEVFSTWVPLVARTILLLFNCPNYCPKAVSWPIVFFLTKMPKIWSLREMFDFLDANKSGELYTAEAVDIINPPTSGIFLAATSEKTCCVFWPSESNQRS